MYCVDFSLAALRSIAQWHFVVGGLLIGFSKEYGIENGDESLLRTLQCLGHNLQRVTFFLNQASFVHKLMCQV